MRFVKKDGAFIVRYDGREHIFPTLRDALEYLFIVREIEETRALLCD